MKKYKVISILAIIITIVNILNLSYASEVESEVANNTIQENLCKENKTEDSNTVDNKENIEESNTIDNKENTEECIKSETIQNNIKEPLENKAQTHDDILITVDQSQLHITNVDKDTNEPIAGNKYTILKVNSVDSSTTVYWTDLTTNEQGKIDITLFVGKFYLQQTFAVDGYSINKSLIELNFETGESISLTVKSEKANVQETTRIVDKQINYSEKNNNIVEKNITDISNIEVTNNNKEIINETNTTNWNNVNHFIDTIDKDKSVTLRKQTIYKNSTQETTPSTNKSYGVSTIESTKTRQEFIDFINQIMADSAVPILPVASK